MKETDFQSSLMRGLKSQGCYCRKWPDLARAVTKPFDICMAYQGDFCPIETKLTKYGRKKPLQMSDIAISPASFTGRGHQIPELLNIYDSGQGDPYLAVCVVRIEMGSTAETRAWMFRASHMKKRDVWTIGDLDQLRFNLVWVPTVGWTAPWFGTLL